jgi:hypothetical protein
VCLTLRPRLHDRLYHSGTLNPENIGLQDIEARTKRRDTWLAFLLRIRDVPGSDLGAEAGHVNLGYRGFPSIPPDKFWDSNLIYAIVVFFHRISNSLFTNHSIIRHCRPIGLIKKGKVIPLHAMEAPGGRGGIAPTHS